LQLTREAPADRQLIQSYNPGQFRVNGVTFHGPVIVSDAAALPWNATSVSTLTLDSFAPLRDMKVDVCLLGCGAKMDRLPKALRDALKEQGLCRADGHRLGLPYLQHARRRRPQDRSGLDPDLTGANKNGDLSGPRLASPLR